MEFVMEVVVQASSSHWALSDLRARAIKGSLHNYSPLAGAGQWWWRRFLEGFIMNHVSNLLILVFVPPVCHARNVKKSLFKLYKENDVTLQNKILHQKVKILYYMLEKNVRLCLYVVLLNTLKCYVWKCIVCTELIHTMTK